MTARPCPVLRFWTALLALVLLATLPAYAQPSGRGRGNVALANKVVVSTLAGKAGAEGCLDGRGKEARFYQPEGVAVDAAGTLYVADTHSYTIRRVTAAGVVSTLASASDNSVGAPGRMGHADGVGAAASFNRPAGVAVDAAGTVYVADEYNHTIRKITATGAVSTLAGRPQSKGSIDGTGTAARFYQPAGVAVDAAGTVYVADTRNHTIRKITAAGVVSTLAGAAGEEGNADGVGTAARFCRPGGMALDAAGTLYVADTRNHTIRKISAAGVVSTLAGVAGSEGSVNGKGAVARFNFPTSVAVDVAGAVYVADYRNHTIRKITAAGMVSTLAGMAGEPACIDGPGKKALFFFPAGVAVNAAGTVYVTENSSTIRVIQ